MNRPTYETSADLERESAVIDRFKEKWDVEVDKLPIRYHLDYIMHRGDKALAFCEIKTRNQPIELLRSWGGFMISLSKWVSAKALVESTGIPFILIYRTLDGDYYTKITDFKSNDGVYYRGRNDRNDWQDMEPCLKLSVERFKKL